MKKVMTPEEEAYTRKAIDYGLSNQEIVEDLMDRRKRLAEKGNKHGRHTDDRS